MATCFENVSLQDDLTLEAVGGPMFSTVVVSTGSGGEQRVGQWSNGRGRWDLSGALRKVSKRDELIAFFRARRGRLHSFRFRDWTDDTLTLQATVELTSTTFQLYKHYTSGSVTIDRKITLPIAASITVYNGSTLVGSGWTLDDTTGILTFGSAPGYVPKVSGHFELPVRFDTDHFAFQQGEPTFGVWPSIPIVEVRGE